MREEALHTGGDDEDGVDDGVDDGDDDDGGGRATEEVLRTNKPAS